MARVTHEVTIYGASDDLIEVEGDRREEFPVGGEGGTVLVIGPCGEAVTVRCELDSMAWSVQPRVVRGTGIGLEVHPRPDGGGDEGDMAVTVRFPLSEESKSAILVYLVERD